MVAGVGRPQRPPSRSRRGAASHADWGRRERGRHPVPVRAPGIAIMKIGLLIGHPTQFEGPLFQYAAQDREHRIRVIYTDPDRMEKVFDPVMAISISWGIDLLSGYSYAVLPRRGRVRWLADEIRREQYDLLIVNSYVRRENLLATLIARRHGTPTALRLDTVPYANASAPKRLLKKGLFSLLSRVYDHFFAVGSLTVDYLRHQDIDADRISLFSYSID